MTVYHIEGTDKYFMGLGEPVNVRHITVKQAQERGFIEKPAKTPDEILHDDLSRMTVAEIEHAMFMAGPRSAEERIGKQVIAEKKAASESEDAELEAEKTKFFGIDGTQIPSRIPR